MNLSVELNIAISAAQSAGKVLVSSRDRILGVREDRGKDLKLDADREAESIILGMLEATPFPVLSEEEGEVGILDSKAPAWIVDPLDGTFNFSRNQPLCCVSIALVQGNQSLLGVVFDFNRSELFAANVPEMLATLNGDPIRVSPVNDPSRACLATGFPVHRDYSVESLREMVDCFQRFKKIRMFGAAALSLAWVACGRVDAYFEEDIMFWDVAAGLALVQAAGGFADIQDSSRLKWGRIVRCGSSPTIWPETVIGGKQQ